MTKEELEKEAEDYAEQCYGWTNNDLALDVAKATYITSAEPREKRIAELEAQIEKMKCCYNCSKWNDGQCADIPDSGYCCADFVCEDWEMKEK
jgi:hypothetical protein